MSTPPQSPELPLEEATPRPQDWQWAKWALKQTEFDTKQEEEGAKEKSSFTQSFYQWRFAYVSFRRAENDLMFEGEPQEPDYYIHKYLATTLAAGGMELIALSNQYDGSFLSDIGFRMENMFEMVKSLEDTLEAFHSSKNKRRVEQLAQRVFGGEARDNI